MTNRVAARPNAENGPHRYANPRRPPHTNETIPTTCASLTC
jgi:hypothetical protein